MAGDDEGRSMSKCKCADIAFSFEPHRERAADASMIARYASDPTKAPEDRAAAIFSRIARHESGHVVASLAHGKQVDYATIGNGNPHVSHKFTSGEMTVDALALIHVAGLVAEGSPAPTWGHVHELLFNARERDGGICDLCRIADLVVCCTPDMPNREQINRVYDCFQTCADLFQSPEWSGALDALAPALEERTILRGAEIMEIVAPFDLTAPLQSTLPIWTSNP